MEKMYMRITQLSPELRQPSDFSSKSTDVPQKVMVDTKMASNEMKSAFAISLVL